MQKGAGNGEAFMILAVLIVIMLVGASRRSPDTSISNNFFGFQASTTTSSASPPSILSAGPTNDALSIYINTGNAPYAYQSYEEYITINNSGREPVDITGWKLKNGKGERAYDVSGKAKYFPSDIAVIPQGARSASPSGINIMQNIVLEPGESAVITTGLAQPQSPYRITSFKENICTGYIESLPEYNFTPSLSSNCPRPANEPGVTGLSNECRQFIDRMPSCHTPKFDTRNPNGEICHNCVDGTSVSSSCLAFIKSHFSYNGCIANHSNDKNFSQNTWRIFLGKGWEMWAKDYETIELFDRLGKLIKRHTY